MRKFGLLGRRLGHSWSPQIHALLADYEYTLHEVEPSALSDFLETTDLAGMNVTIPYKKDVLPFCATLSDAAARIGSVNTLTRTAQGWHGDNTDYTGFKAMVRACGVSPAGKKALVFGSGGASLAVIAALRDLGANPIVNISRSGENHYGNLSLHSDAQILVNTTPLGMYPNTGVSPAGLDGFPHCEAVLDIVYNPVRPRFLLDAEAHGIPCAGGLTMLVAQAKASAEQFAGVAIPDSRTNEIVDILQKQMQNIILIGMPGCGKSTVGRRLARLLNRPFVDADNVIAETAGKSIPEIFSEAGEAGFRKRETDVLADLGKRSGTVIATGGGCITRPENYPLLHQNGVIIWIQRALEQLPTDGRPLSQVYTQQTLYEQRKHLYAAFADRIVQNDESIDVTLEIIKENLL